MWQSWPSGPAGLLAQLRESLMEQQKHAGSAVTQACLHQAGMLVSSRSQPFLLQVFLGRLRESEMERLHERISSAVMETCLAMTIFREDFNVESVAMFVMLTFVKVQPVR